ncbi:MAG: chaperonin GroEL [Simkaniaceae bacterium]|nr:chaperonin GroEL [Simkaniaceae bacterium]
MKDLVFEETREKLLEGIDILADVIGPTLGPKGLNVGLDASWGAPKITNDGHSVVDDVETKDQYVNMGVALGKEVSSKIKDNSGDGTTTGIILTRELVRQGVKHIAAGASPILVKRGMEKTVDALKAKLEESAMSVEKDEDIRNIARVSASGDASIGDVICQAIELVGKKGVITIEDGKGTETGIEMVKGMRFDRGYMSGYFMTDAEKQICEMSNPKILVTDKKVSSIQEILNLLQTAAAGGSEFLIIADDVEGDALSTLVVNKLRGTLKIAAVKAPGFGDKKKAMLEDIAVLTGATLVTADTDMSLKDADPAVLGSCERVEITKDHTTLVGGAAPQEAIDQRVKLLEAERAAATSKYDQEKLDERIGKFSKGVAMIRVGAHTEPELKRRKQIFNDSLNSTRAAVDSGVVLGGGVALLNAAKALKLELSGDEAIGMQIVCKALEAPFRQIVKNSGHDPAVYIAQVGGNMGFNAASDQMEDLAAAGVIDPAKVVINSLTYAASTAGVVLLSEVLIGDAEEEA